MLIRGKVKSGLALGRWRIALLAGDGERAGEGMTRRDGRFELTADERLVDRDLCVVALDGDGEEVGRSRPWIGVSEVHFAEIEAAAASRWDKLAAAIEAAEADAEGLAALDADQQSDRIAQIARRLGTAPDELADALIARRAGQSGDEQAGLFALLRAGILSDVAKGGFRVTPPTLADSPVALRRRASGLPAEERAAVLAAASRARIVRPRGAGPRFGAAKGERADRTRVQGGATFLSGLDAQTIDDAFDAAADLAGRVAATGEHGRRALARPETALPFLRAKLSERETGEPTDNAVQAKPASRKAAAAAAARSETGSGRAFVERLNKAKGKSAFPFATRLAGEFLAARPETDLRTVNIARLFRETNRAGPEDEALKGELLAVQRLHRLAPDFEDAERLSRAGLMNARAIAATAREAFVKRLGKEGMTKTEARRIHARAEHVHARTVILAGEIRTLAEGVKPQALPQTSSSALMQMAQDFPDIATLFGSTDYCECGWCRKVGGPAAYVVDTIDFLDKRTARDSAGGFVNPKTVLFARRPDLGRIDLSCANAETELPYIDLVNELLEDLIEPEPDHAFAGPLAAGPASASLVAAIEAAGWPIGGEARVFPPAAPTAKIWALRDPEGVYHLTPSAGGFTVRRTRQTLKPSAALKAAPAYLNPAPYVTLAGAKIGFGLPFVASVEAARKRLEQAGLSRAALMNLLRPGGAAKPTETETAAEMLGLSDAERQLVTIAGTPAILRSVFQTGGLAADVKLKRAADFLVAADLTPAGLDDLLATDYLNPRSAAPVVTLVHLDASCDYAKKELVALDENANGTLDRAQRLLRLARKSGWPIEDLDNAIAAPRIGARKLDDAALAALAGLARLEALTGTSRELLLPIFGSIPDRTRAEDREALFARLFLTPGPDGKIEGRFKLKAIKANEALAAADPARIKLAAVREPLAFALGITAVQVDKLIALALPRLGADADALTRRALAEVAALPHLAKALALELDTILGLLPILGNDPLASPAAAVRFAERTGQLRAFGLTVEDVRFFLADEAEDIARRRLDDAAVRAILVKLQAAFLTVDKSSPSSHKPDETLAQTLAKAVDMTEAAVPASGAAIDALARGDAQIGGAPAATVLTAFIAAAFTDPDLGLLPAAGAIEPLRAAIATELAAAAGDLDAAPVAAARRSFAAALLDALAADKRRRGRKAAVVAALGAAFKVDERMARALAGAKLRAQLGNGPDARVLVVLGNLPLVDTASVPPALPDPQAAAFATGYAAIRMAHKVAQLAAALTMKADELAAVLRVAPSGWLVPDAMRVNGAGPAASFNQLEKLIGGLAVQRARPAAERPEPLPPADYFTVLAEAAVAANRTPVLTAMAAWTGHTLERLEALDTHFGLSAGGIAAAYADPAQFIRLDGAAIALRTLRIGLPTALALLAPVPPDAQVAALAAALKTSYDEATWLTVEGDFHDRMRRLRRDALLGYLIATRAEFANADDVKDHILLDPLMMPCRMTSRIVAAHSSLQTFIARCREGTENDCAADETVDPKWSQWDWQAFYRVYEAAITVFCNPQDYLEPDLRDDKSPFFKEFETALMQGQLDDDLVEDAAAAYLASADKVGRLEVIASHYQADGLNTTHVLARTYGGDPTEYFYRRFDGEREWTHWQKVDLEIGTDIVILFTRRNRLNVAWLVMVEEANRDEAQTVPNNSAGTEVGPGEHRWKLQLATSEFDGKKWSARKISREAIKGDWTTQPLPSRRGFRLSTVSLSQLGEVLQSPDIETFVERATANDTDMIMVSYDRSAGNEGGNEDGPPNEKMIGGFSLSGCSGAPEPFVVPGTGIAYMPQFRDCAIREMRISEQQQPSVNDLAILDFPWSLASFRPILGNTPDQALRPITNFRVAWPMQMSIIDILLFVLLGGLSGAKMLGGREKFLLPLGTLMPFFFQDGERSHVVVPGFYRIGKDGHGGTTLERKTFSDMHRLLVEGLTLLAMLLNILDGLPASEWKKARTDFRATTRYKNWVGEMVVMLGMDLRLRFRNFYHPHICAMRTRLSRGGVPGLISRETQDLLSPFQFAAADEYDPQPIVLPDYPVEDVDFTREGAYAGINSELFIHMPWYVAMKCMRAGDHAGARRWLRLVFDPSGASSDPVPARYWVAKPFREMSQSDYAAQRIEAILYESASHPGGVGLTESISSSIATWRAKPFLPFAIARTRPVAFQKAIVRTYVDNLIAWGDSQFRLYTGETIDNAARLYQQAARILGPKPQIAKPAVEPVVMCYDQLAPLVDLLGNALIGLENLVETDSDSSGPPPTLPGPAFALPYFCLAPSDKTLTQHNIIEGRLFNIRHCRNIEGVEVPVSLFAPPIDPAALVRAAAAGLSIGEILAGFGAPLPFYRFRAMIEKAKAFTSELRALGSAVNQAIEKGDAERLSALRNQQEQALAKATIAVKKIAVREAEAQIDTLERQKATIEARRNWLRSRDFMSPLEIAAMTLNGLALIPNSIATVLQFGGAAVSAAPNFQIGASGFGGSPHVTVTWGSSNIVGMMSGLAQGLSGVGGLLNSAAGIVGTLASYARRQDEWKHQAEQEDMRLKELAKQKVAAEIRVDIAKADLASQELQLAQAQQTGEFLSSKFTSAELYDWALGRLNSVHYAAYQLALDHAKQAERCLKAEVGGTDSYVQVGHWDGLRKGLLAGDLLMQDLSRMEAAYMALNPRLEELTKSISLAMLDPLALERLRATGKCTFTVPEALFDLDHPGHYHRRIKTVAVSIPSVAGPQTSVAARVTMSADRYRANTDERAGAQPFQRYAGQPNDPRFVANRGGIVTFSTSTALNDSGTFEQSLSDERYLHCEGAGAESTWTIETQSVLPTFDATTISDVILTMRYTAKRGGGTFRKLVEDSLVHQVETMAVQTARSGLFFAIDLRRDMPAEWQQLKTTGAADIPIASRRMPWLAQAHGATISHTAFAGRAAGNPASIAIKLGATPVTLAAPAGSKIAESAFSNAGLPVLDGTATISVPSAAERDKLEDLVLVAKLDLA